MSRLKNMIFKGLFGLLSVLFLSGGALPGGIVETFAQNYPIWFGRDQITDVNKNDLPLMEGDNGKASYDPESKTLTLENVTKGPARRYENAQSAIYVDGQSLTIEGKGSAPNCIGDGSLDNAILVVNSSGKELTLKGNLKLKGKIDVVKNEQGLITCLGEVEIVSNTGSAVNANDMRVSDQGRLTARTTSGSILIYCPQAFNVGEKSVVKAYGGTNSIISGNIHIYGAVYAASKSEYALYGKNKSPNPGNIEISQTATVYFLNENGNTGAVYYDNDLNMYDNSIVWPENGTKGSSTIKDGDPPYNPANEVLINGKNSHLDKTKISAEIKKDSPTDGSIKLWNTLKGLYVSKKIKGSGLYNDGQSADYDLDNDGYYDITAEKTDSGCKLYALPGPSIDDTFELTGEGIIECEYDALKNNDSGLQYCLSAGIKKEAVLDCGEKDVDFVKSGNELVFEGNEGRHLFNTLERIFNSDAFSTQGTELADFQIDVDKDGKSDVGVKCEGQDKVTITLLPTSSLKEDAVLPLDETSKSQLNVGEKTFYSSIKFVVKYKHNKGNTAVDFSNGSVKADNAVKASILAAGESGKIRVNSSSDTEKKIDLEKDGHYDILMKEISETESELSELSGRTVEDGPSTLTLDDAEKRSREVAEEDFYDTIVFTFKKNAEDNGDDPKDPSKQISRLLSNTVSENVALGSDTINIEYNNFVQFDGRTHNAIGKDASGNLGNHKETSKKAYDIKVKVIYNGEVMDPGKYTIKTKNNKAASVSINGITQIITDQKKLPVYKIKFKGKELKAANDAFKDKEFHFGIIPAGLTGENTEPTIKKGKKGTLKLKKVTFKPSSQGVTLKPVKLKFNKKEAKTDYLVTDNQDGSLTITGKNNYFGDVRVGG